MDPKVKLGVANESPIHLAIHGLLVPCESGVVYDPLSLLRFLQFFYYSPDSHH